MQALAARGSLVFCLLITCVSSSLAQAPRHPLDALSAQEFWTVYEVMHASGRVDSLTRFFGVNLREPPKAEVLRWRAGQPFRREALAVVRNDGHTYEAVVDLRGSRLLSWQHIEGVQPFISDEEYEMVDELTKEHPEFRAALQRRGITDLNTVHCGPTSPGYFGTAEEQGRRLAFSHCEQQHRAWSGMGRTIEGVSVLIDLDEGEVLRVTDNGAVLLPPGSADHDAAAVGTFREVPSPILVQQPQGPGYQLDGTEVSWQNWRFHFRVDPRVGTIVSNVRYLDGDRERPIMYQGSLSEVFVPYMDPASPYYSWTFLDLGEYVADGFAKPMERGTDCPAHATYFNTVFADYHGVPQRRPRVACLFEREDGELAWRHSGIHTSGPFNLESRPRRDLVLRMVPTVGNYDYILDWIFQQDGTIRVVAGASGHIVVKTVKSRTAAEDRTGQDGAYGRFVGENIVAPNHDHFLVYRLDLDVDGPNNALVVDELKRQRLPDDHPRRSVWTVESRTARTEREGMLHMSMEHPTQWRVVNPGVRGKLGYPTGYQIVPGHMAKSLLSEDDYPQRRAGFTNHHLWTTPYRAEELYAAGDYPTQSKGGDGLPSWTSANRSIDNTDIVVWYTMGFHHVPRMEEWPVMPTVTHEFQIRPFDFFNRNPALDLPPQR
jgi:primary-amine oxidase